MSVTVLPCEVSEPEGIDPAFAAFKRERPGGLWQRLSGQRPSPADYVTVIEARD